MEQQNLSATNERILFMDNVRYLMVLLVVVLHICCAYSILTQWWPVNDKNAAPFSIILLILDVILMPTLFFISGYFALCSIQSKSTVGFIKRKIFRLGVPWIIGVIMIHPITVLAYCMSRNYPINLWDTFINSSKKILQFYTGIINNSIHFNQTHLWYISLLLFFLIVFAVLYKLKIKLIQNNESVILKKSASSKKILLSFIFAAICTAVLSIILYINFVQFMGKEPWLLIASFIQFQPTRIAIYVVCFILGIFAFHNHWFIDGKVPLHPAVWSILSAILFICLIITAKANVQSGFNNSTIIYAYIFFRVFAIFSTILALLSLSGRYWQSASKINLSLAQNSYIIYLIHLPIVFAFQLILLKFDISLYLKFFIGSAGSIAASYLISEFTFRRYPKASTMVLIVLFAIGICLI